jgi:membrane protein DedA with SNARE-associated domain
VTYGGLFLYAMYDRTGTPIPVVTAGVAAAIGLVEWPLVMPLMVIAGMIGEYAYYFSGRGVSYVADRLKWTEKVTQRIPRIVRNSITTTSVGKPVVLIFGRFLPVVGRLVAPLSGLTEVRLSKFSLYTLIGQSMLVVFYFFTAWSLARLNDANSLLSAESISVVGFLWILPVLVAILAQVLVWVKSRFRSAR